jgi:hypothetical protein
LFLVSKLAAGGTVALGFGAAVEALWPEVSGRVAAVIVTVALTIANYFGIKKAGRLNTAIVCVSVAVLTLFVATGLSAFDASHLRPFAPAGIPGVLEAAALLFFAYTGYDPAGDRPRAEPALSPLDFRGRVGLLRAPRRVPASGHDRERSSDVGPRFRIEDALASGLTRPARRTTE